MRKLKILFLKVSQDLETTLDHESAIFKVFCKTNYLANLFLKNSVFGVAR